MKPLVLLLLIQLSMSSMAQTRFLISDTSKVSYSPLGYWANIDSVVFIHSKIDPPFCKPYEVYFDKEFQILAYKSESIGDSCISYDYWRNGQLKKRTVYIRDSDGLPMWWFDELYCENSALIFKGFSPNQSDKKLYTHYYCNGNKRLEFYHIGTGADGKMTRWYENGNLESESYFDDDEPIGKWLYYNENGNLSKEEVYENGNLIETKIH